MASKDDDDGEITAHDRPKLKLSEQLVMTPQLQMAIRLLALSASELPKVIDEWRANHPGAITDLAPGEVDPYDEQEVEDAAENDQAPWFYFDEEPFPSLGADVWVFGNPPQARINGRAMLRLKAVFDDRQMTRSASDVREASWLVRSLRQRAKTYERVVAALIALRPQLAIAVDPSQVEAVKLRDVAEAVGMHESTIQRVATACRYQTIHGVVKLVASSVKLTFQSV